MTIHLADVPDAVVPAPARSGYAVPPLVALVMANGVSISANVVMTVAIPWLVLSTTGSAAMTGLVVFAGAGGAAAGGLVAGGIVDRFGPVRTSALSDLFSGLAIAPLPLLIALGRLEIWQVIVLALVGTFVDAAGSTARQGMVPAVADRDGTARERANAMFTSAEHVGYLLGAPLAGVLIAMLGVSGALVAVVAAFAVGPLLVVRYVRVPDGGAADVAREDVGLRAVLTFIWSDPALRALFVFPTLAVTLVGPIVPIVLPVLAQQAFTDPIVLGAMIASYGVGGLLGTAAYGLIGARVSRRLLYRGVFVVWPAMLTLIALFPSLAVSMVTLLILGSAVGVLVPLQATIRQERSPAHLLPRVVGLSTASIPVMAPIGVLVTGVLIDLLSLQRTLLLTSAGAIAIGVAVVMSKATHTFDRFESRSAEPGACAVA